jgi:uncharacterized protein YceK
MRAITLAKAMVTGGGIIFACAGCGTIVTRTSAGNIARWDHSKQFATVYPATCVDGFAVFGASSDGATKQVGQRIGFFFDLPFSLAIDTVLLPYDIYKACSTDSSDDRVAQH